jgi:hypothetical protein
MSFRPEVVADSTGKFIPNGLRFATQAEAEAYAKDLMFRWTSVTDTRAVECTDPVNSRWEGGRTVALTND